MFVRGWNSKFYLTVVLEWTYTVTIKIRCWTITPRVPIHLCIREILKRKWAIRLSVMAKYHWVHCGLFYLNRVLLVSIGLVLTNKCQLFACTGYHSDSEEIDVKSCILSLIELYVHWLRQPVHTVLLNHILQSIVMLSDLFAVVCNPLHRSMCVVWCFLCHIVQSISVDVGNSLWFVWQPPTWGCAYSVVDGCGNTESRCSSQVCKFS